MGRLMVLIVSPEEGDKRLFFHAFAGFCFLIAFACVARGRPRQFVGSAIGAVAFASGLWHLAATRSPGALVSALRGEPSIVNALLFMAFFGPPGADYAWRRWRQVHFLRSSS